MPLQIINRDITEMSCDAIVNPTDHFYSGSGGTDLAIHRAAGEKLRLACSELPPLDFGEVTVCPGFELSCRYIIHTMGPVWRGGCEHERALLRSCYINSLVKAKRLGLRSIAFPLIASGTFGFPKDKVLRIAIDAITDFLFTTDGEMDVYICVLDRDSFVLSKEVALNRYLGRSKRFIYENHRLIMEPTGIDSLSSPLFEDDYICASPQPMEKSAPVCASAPCPAEVEAPKPKSLSAWIKKQDDTFAVLLLKLIDKKGMDDVECYKKANVHKNVFWKIKNDGKYRPSKPTVIAFAISLELNLEETQALLRSAGFALSHNNLFDMIIEFYIINENYDIFEINAALYRYDQMCLGC